MPREKIMVPSSPPVDVSEHRIMAVWFSVLGVENTVAVGIQ